MIRTRGISHVELPVRDVERAARFYGDVFGFEVVVTHEGGARLQTPGGHGSITLQASVEADAVGGAHFGLVLSDPAERDAAVRLAVACGGTLVEWTDHPVGGSTAVVADPSGHRITL
jgi:catechol 2,3-dioxygenase-like lactoylglutathione lyase family enzyme